ncbi:MAG: FAD-binding oxidoreductase [Balneolaceae bacterium]
MPEIILPEVELNIYSPKSPAEATIVENYVCTAESSPNIIRHITFDISGTDLEGKFRVGQSIGVLPPGENEKGRPHKLRLYSVSSPSAGEGGKKHLVSTTVKRAMDEVEGTFYTGVCSNYICNLKPGDKVKVTGPSGRRYLLPENVDDFNYVFFATGTGIAPFRGMIIELFESGFKGDVALVFGCPYRTDVIYPKFFTEMAEKHDNFHYIKMISREDRRDDGSKYYVQTAIDDQEETLSPILGKDNTLIYLCGMKGMESGIYHNLAKKGFMDYLLLKGELAVKNPADWSWEEVKKLIKPSTRTFEEVY